MLQNLLRSPAVRVIPHLEGQDVRNGQVCLGMRAGPALSLANLLHEMGHLLEIDDARVTSPGWGLRLGRLRSWGRHHWREFRTDAPVRRELRVGAFQFVLGQASGIYRDPHAFAIDYARTMSFMPLDCLCFYASGDDITERCIAGVRREIDGLDLAVVVAEWWRKQAIIVETMGAGSAC